MTFYLAQLCYNRMKRSCTSDIENTNDVECTISMTWGLVTGTICLYVCQSVYSSIHPFINPTIRPSVRLSVYLPTYLPTYLPSFLPSYLPTYLPTYLPIFLPTPPSIQLSVCLSVCLPTYLPIHPSIHPRFIQTRSLKHFDNKEFINDFKTANWLEVDKIRDVNLAWCSWKCKEKASRTGTAEDWAYRRKRNEVNLAVKHAKITFYQNSISNNTDNPKKTWSILNGFMCVICRHFWRRSESRVSSSRALSFWSRWKAFIDHKRPIKAIKPFALFFL